MDLEISELDLESKGLDRSLYPSSNTDGHAMNAFSCSSSSSNHGVTSSLPAIAGSSKGITSSSSLSHNDAVAIAKCDFDRDDSSDDDFEDDNKPMKSFPMTYQSMADAVMMAAARINSGNMMISSREDSSCDGSEIIYDDDEIYFPNLAEVEIYMKKATGNGNIPSSDTMFAFENATINLALVVPQAQERSPQVEAFYLFFDIFPPQIKSLYGMFSIGCIQEFNRMKEILKVLVNCTDFHITIELKAIPDGRATYYKDQVSFGLRLPKAKKLILEYVNKLPDSVSIGERSQQDMYIRNYINDVFNGVKSLEIATETTQKDNKKFFNRHIITRLLQSNNQNQRRVYPNVNKLMFEPMDLPCLKMLSSWRTLATLELMSNNNIQWNQGVSDAIERIALNSKDTLMNFKFVILLLDYRNILEKRNDGRYIVPFNLPPLLQLRGLQIQFSIRAYGTVELVPPEQELVFPETLIYYSQMFPKLENLAIQMNQGPWLSGICDLFVRHPIFHQSFTLHTLELHVPPEREDSVSDLVSEFFPNLRNLEMCPRLPCSNIVAGAGEESDEEESDDDDIMDEAGNVIDLNATDDSDVD